MAVLPSSPAIKISIVCNGASLQEYDDDDEEPHPGVISKYIEAISGAEFGIQFELTLPWPSHAIRLDYHLDQKWVHSVIVKPVDCRHPSYISLVKGSMTVRAGQTFLHKFAFAALNIDDVSAAPVREALMKHLKGLGEITIHAHFVKNVHSYVVNERTPRNNFEELGNIPEKALKGSSLSHHASLRAGQALNWPQARESSGEYVDPTGLPFATYNFKYRSRDSLKSLLIIPRSPSPVPLEQRPVDTLSVEEMRLLLLRQREREAAAKAVKQERGIKRERRDDRSNTLAADADDDELSFVSAKKRRVDYRTTFNEDGAEVFDLT